VAFLQPVNLIPQIFVPFCASLTKQATLKSFVTGSMLIDFNKTMEMGAAKY